MDSPLVAQQRFNISRSPWTSGSIALRLFAGLLVISASFAAMAQSAGGGLRIAIASKETQRPLEGVNVTVTGRLGGVMTRRTEANGTVELGGLVAGL